MLPEAKKYLISDGLAPSTASFVLIGCFLAGVIGIQIASGVLHRYIPTHVVDCDHEHEHEHGEHEHEHEHEHGHEHEHEEEGTYQSNSSLGPPARSERTPLLSAHNLHGSWYGPISAQPTSSRESAPEMNRRASFPFRVPSSVSSIVYGTKSICDEDGPCRGFSDPCGNQCLQKASFEKNRSRHGSLSSKWRRKSGQTVSRTESQRTFEPQLDATHEEDEEAALARPGEQYNNIQSHTNGTAHLEHNHRNLEVITNGAASTRSCSPTSKSPQRLRASSYSSTVSDISSPSHAQHHHHVPQNAFLSIGLQTSAAIALHKLPEGFITYATNHANPRLGFNIFLALFIHNLTEGFVLALPLFLAIQSRWKAMFWSALLGGVSQPAGAGIAALWFHLANGSQKPSETVYGAMFAVTAGIMASVALSLFSESLTIHHSKSLCMTFAFIGMGILGVSSALTA
jgi:ZIP family zinc transporter